MLRTAFRTGCIDAVEIDLQDCVSSGGWEALEYNQTDLLAGAPGAAPQHKGLRAVRIASYDMLLVAARHQRASCIKDPDHLASALRQARRVVTHDTATTNVRRNAGLLSSNQVMLVRY